jgi:hypothetical protein
MPAKEETAGHIQTITKKKRIDFFKMLYNP